MIKLSEITKTYRMGQIEVRALKGINLRIEKHEFVSIMGASGSGKSTLMNIVGCLDRPTSGSYFLDGSDVSNLSDNELAGIRNKKIGFVFQTFNLLPRMTALKNVELPLIYSGMKDARRRENALRALEQVELADRAKHKPNELSGGQRQRVAIARALVNNPGILFADEPTGNLDSRTGYAIIALFQKLHSLGATIIMVTHEMDIALQAKRIIHLKDGEIVGDEIITNPKDAASEMEGSTDLNRDKLSQVIRKHGK